MKTMKKEKTHNVYHDVRLFLSKKERRTISKTQSKNRRLLLNSRNGNNIKFIDFIAKFSHDAYQKIYRHNLLGYMRLEMAKIEKYTSMLFYKV